MFMLPSSLHQLLTEAGEQVIHSDSFTNIDAEGTAAIERRAKRQAKWACQRDSFYTFQE